MPDETRLPIRVVVTGERDYVKPEGGGGGGRKVFDEVSLETREAFVHQLDTLRLHFQSSFAADEPAPAVGKVVLKEKALAKSHRPMALLQDTCPIIGVGSIGQLLISLRPEGIEKLQERIRTLATKHGVADISTINSIAPYTIEDTVGTNGLDVLRHEVESKGSLKLKLFRHRFPDRDSQLQAAFAALVRALRLDPPERLPYSPRVFLYKIRTRDPSVVEPLAKFVGTQSLSRIPKYGLLENASTAVRRVAAGEFPAPDPARNYPIVGIIDSGTDPRDQLISPWVVARHNYVTPGDEDFGHGTFVAGMAIYGNLTNNGDHRFPSCPVKIVDVAAVPKSGLDEDQLLSILEEVIPKHPEVRVWNLSLGVQDPPCQDGAFSDLAVKLDDLQERHGITFVIAAGNYQTVPLRGWPPEDLGEADRICAPADSVRAITVGSIAHLERPACRVRSEQPSPFTRRGPGPVFLPKPELSHYGGNCDDVGNYMQTGVLSFDGQGNVAEDIGTSFATPIVSSLLGSVDESLLNSSRTLSRALVIHSALLRSKGVTSEDLRYRGFGIPGDLTAIVSCARWEATLVLEPELEAELELEKTPFPIPAALRTPDGKVKGEFFITLCYDPPLDSSYGAEYCRTNVDVSLGTYGLGKDGKYHHRRQIPPEPRDITQMFERQLVEHGFKWAPNKVYYRRISQGVAGTDWRLKVSLVHRAGFQAPDPQQAVLIITMADPDKQAPVYDQTAALMDQFGWQTHNLEISERLRLQG